MKLVLVDDGGENTVVYNYFYRTKIGTYKTSDGVEGLMKMIGVEIIDTISSPDVKSGKNIDPTDGFPYNLDNVPGVKPKRSTKRKSK